MSSNPHQFLSFAQQHQVLRFGSFVTKAGRLSPYFFNTGTLSTGSTLAALGEFYAEAYLAALASGRLAQACDLLFGPAYKGIPLVSTTSIALAQRGTDLPFAFNRKEVKDHGEGGDIVGAPLRGRVLIIDDVISAGTSVRESVAIIERHGATPAGVLIAMDRMERGGNAEHPSEQSAVQEVEQRYGIPVIPIVNLDDLIGWAMAGDTDEVKGWAEAVKGYRERWGV